jgi:hypothetical protein
MALSSAQLAAARALLRWSALGTSPKLEGWRCDYSRVEVLEGEIPVTSANEAAIRTALEKAGVEFIDENGGGSGVRLKNPTPK